MYIVYMTTNHCSIKSDSRPHTGSATVILIYPHTVHHERPSFFFDRNYLQKSLTKFNQSISLLSLKQDFWAYKLTKIGRKAGVVFRNGVAFMREVCCFPCVKIFSFQVNRNCILVYNKNISILQQHCTCALTTR